MNNIVFLCVMVLFIACLNSSMNCESCPMPICEQCVLDRGEFSKHHNSRTSLDWAGTYSGTIPGADNPGIFVQITLNWDESYEIHYHYVGKSDDVFTFTGYFSWDDKGGTITLDSNAIPMNYKVGEGFLLQLDMQGNVITGELAEMYRLRLN